MALQKIDINTPQPNGKFGESTRSANIKYNSNITEIGERLEALEDGDAESISGLREDLQQEVQARTLADSQLQQDVEQEALARESADTQISTRQHQVEQDVLDLALHLQEVPGCNLLMNCGIPINQRVFSGGSLAAGNYGYDRWKAGPGGGNVVIDPVTGQFNHNSGPLVQVIESPAGAWGQPLFISVENPSGPLQVSVGGATGTITAGTGRRGVQLTPSGSGHMIVQLTATGVTYRRPKVERGTSAFSFEFRNTALELLLCQRYYEKSYAQEVAPGTAGAVSGQEAYFLYGVATAQYSFGGKIPFKVQKRSAPAVTCYSTQSGAPGKAWSAAPVTDVNATVESVGSSGAFITIGPVTSNNLNCRWQWTADSEIY
ncbi:hypothetical protein [Stenotrophomonas maltophilia]|uniref:hypothetical protein n=1 Tax=Stenotrophomonas maltophilia TaxID=40324 RepID=UPI0039F69DD2